MPDDISLPRRAFLRRSASAAAIAGVGLSLARSTARADGLPRRPAGTAEGQDDPVNVQVSHDGFAMHAEPALAANPRDPRNLLGVCIVSSTDVTHGLLATYMSLDGGASWRGNGVLPGIPTTGIDPSVAFDARGTGFVCGLVGSERQSQDAGAYIWRTQDGGRTFLPPVTAIAGVSDHPSVAVARQAAPDDGIVYVATALNPGLAFTRSLDGGRSFQQPRTLDKQAAGPVIAAGPAGTVCISYPAPVAPMSSGAAVIRVITSTDHGATFGPPADLVRVSVAPYFNLPAIAVDPRTGDIHVAVASYDTATHRSRLLVFSSRDHGRTWRTPVLLAGSEQVTYLQPELVVEDAGQVVVSAFADRQGRVDVLLFASEPRQGRFGSPLRVTSQPFDASLGGPGNWIGDYQGLAATPGAVHPFWNDTRTGELEIFTATVPLR